MSVHDIGDHELRIRQLEEEVAALKKIIAKFYPIEAEERRSPNTSDRHLTE
jgi:hypothetical protein